MSVRLSVRHTRDPHLNGSRYRKTYHTIQQNDVYSFLTSNLVALILGVDPERMWASPIDIENLTNNLQ